MTDEPKKIGRPATGQKAGKEYLAKFRENLAKSGGTTININVGPDAAHALEAIMRHQGNDATKKGAKKAAVEAALIALARKVLRG